MADKKNTLAADFDRLNGKIDTLFRPIYDPLDEFYFKLIAEFQKAGVDFLEINHVKKSAIAKHSNYYEYPERRYAVTVNDKNKVKFYELEYSNSEAGDSPTAKEISQKEFEGLTIPTYLKPNPLMSKEDQEQDKTPDDVNYPEGSKKKEDKDAINRDKPKDHPEIKNKTVKYGETLAPKNKLKELSETIRPSFGSGFDMGKRTPAEQGSTRITPDTYTGTVGNLGPMGETVTVDADLDRIRELAKKKRMGTINSIEEKELISLKKECGIDETLETAQIPAPGLTDSTPGDEVPGMYEKKCTTKLMRAKNAKKSFRK